MKTKFVPVYVACFSTVLAAGAAAQQSWQKVQMPTATEVAKVWTAPPSEYGPEPYFGMNGAVTIETLSKDLDMMKSIGFHAVTAQAGGGMTTTYLSPEYFAFFKQFVEEAKKRDMRVWIVDDIGYPSGFAGGKFADKPELQMQALTLLPRVTVAAGAKLQQAVTPNTVAATATGPAGEKVAVPIVGGAIDWTAPAGSGSWSVALVEHVQRTSPTKSDTNPTHAKDSSQPLEDYLNPAATAAYLEYTHNAYYKAMPEEFGKTILGFRGDEPDYSISGLPWTPALLDTFQKVKGYDARPYLVAMLSSQGGRGQAAPKLSDKELQAKADYYDVFSQMFRDGFFKPQGVWCAAHSVEYQVHLNHEEMEMQLVRSEGDFMRDMKYVEVPGIDSIWHQIWTDTVSDFPRLAASASHLYGHPRAFTETFAAYRPEPDITMARYIINEQMVRGVNLFETMFYSATGVPRPAAATPPPPTATLPAGEGSAASVAPPRRGGPSAVMRDPGWPALMQYTQRMSYVLSMGRPAAAVALYLPSDSMWLGDAAADVAFVSTERMLGERQIDFDIVGVDSLESELKSGVGTLETVSGNKYKVVILPSISVLPQASLDRLKAFAKGGGKVLFLGRTPALISGKSILDARAATPADFAWATVETSDQLAATPTPPAQAPPAPPPAQIVSAAIETALGTVIGPREIALDAPDTALRVLTRRLKDANVYLFFNEGATASTHSVTIRTDGAKVEGWDPVAGTVSAVDAKAGKGSVTVKLDLKPYETRLLTVR
jgi:alpha-L-rhamnosidase